MIPTSSILPSTESKRQQVVQAAVTGAVYYWSNVGPLLYRDTIPLVVMPHDCIRYLCITADIALHVYLLCEFA
jgi:hypothetical protein